MFDHDDCNAIYVNDYYIAGSADDTYMIQAAYNAAMNGSKKHLIFPDRVMQISATITISATVITGLRSTGGSKISTQINQNTDNIPIFNITGQIMHSNVWEHMQFSYKNMQTGNTNAVVFQINGNPGSSFFNSVFENIWSQNHYMFMTSPVVNWWGNTYRDCVFGDFAGGINSITSISGEPNCRFERLYINCPSATQTLFVHSGVTAQFDSIEVNAVAGGVSMLNDGGGGNYVIGHWAIEVATYNSNTILFNVPNGFVTFGYIYTNTLTIGTGAILTGVVSNGSISYTIGQVWQASFASNLGTFELANFGGPRTSHFNKLDIPWAANVLPWDVAGTVTADYVVVDEWNDQSTTKLNGDASVTITNNSAFHQVFTGLTANRIATLPEHRALPACLLFSGWRRRFLKTDTSAFSLTVNNSLGTAIASIPASQRGVIEVFWERSLANWVLADVRTF